MREMPTHDIKGKEIDQTEENLKLYSRRFNNDKI